ncbi:MAG: glycoside hydrolase family 3 C-terminal domain-containing protein, partial [Clostridiales bacterium]|nr:glycoside hydrolase family 3 C-terminal domain-containing protein [Clostridiales bacterium]
NNNILPLKKNETVAVFGRCAIDWFAVGYGSGGDVLSPYIVNLIDGLRHNGVRLNEKLLSTYRRWRSQPKNEPFSGYWGHWPYSYDEMLLNSETVKAAAAESDTAVVVIGRAAGEDRENKLKKGSYYLTDEEENMLSLVTTAFKKTAVVLNIGNVIDMAWTDRYNIGAVLLAWQGGMESGNAAADVLCGKVNPCGKLTDTIARHYEDYPSAYFFGNRDFSCYSEDIYVGYRFFETFDKSSVMFPFGFGMSYTSFEVECENAVICGTEIKLSVSVKNTGELAGKETAQVYMKAPEGSLDKPSMVLCGFFKTGEIQPKETEKGVISFDLKDFASYDDSGKTGRKSAFVLESGTYEIYLGSSVRNCKKVFETQLSDLIVVQQLSEVMAVKGADKFKRLVNRNGGEYEYAPTVTTCLQQIIINNIPEDIPVTGDRGFKLKDAADGKISIDDFIAQLSDEELELLTRGEGKMDSPLGAAGNAGVFGGVAKSLRDKGIPPIITTDGPAGIRLKSVCSLLPCGTLLACTWDTELVKELYGCVSDEMTEKGTDVLLAPGMNIHRNPLCGRNFEYFSEDPFLSGKMGSACVLGIQSGGHSACPKHFACNNRETRRNKSDSRVSERALREIYLKNFEICIKESKPLNIMTSYNKINGVWSHYNYELCETVLRKEWGYEGNVITDWWMQYAHSPEFPQIRDNAYRVRARVNVLMPGFRAFNRQGKDDTSLLETLGQFRGITRGEIQRAVKDELQMIIRLKKCDIFADGQDNNKKEVI